MYYEDKIPKQIDWFPIVKAHVSRCPIKTQRALLAIINRELSGKNIEDMLYHERMLIEADLHELIDYHMDLYYEALVGEL